MYPARNKKRLPFTCIAGHESLDRIISQGAAEGARNTPDGTGTSSQMGLKPAFLQGNARALQFRS
jgi:hypothetical protein